MRNNRNDPSRCDCEAAELRTALEKAGWRFTRQRAAVFNHLQSVQNHPTAEDVYAAVRNDLPKISLATVYKALEALVDSGVAAKLTYSDGACRYDCRSDDHYHLRCTRTHQVRDLAVPFDPQLLHKLDPRLTTELEQQGFHVTGYRLEVLGQFQDK